MAEVLVGGERGVLTDPRVEGTFGSRRREGKEYVQKLT